MEKLKIVKIGGKMVDDKSKLNSILDAFANVKEKCLLVHGGASQSDVLLERLGIEKVKHEGRRITDAATLEVCVMVYAGLLNKQIVADLSQRGAKAVGLSGADLNIIQAEKRPVKDIDYGYVGDIKQVNKNAIMDLLLADIKPVFCAITHDNKGQLLNTNGDTIAASLALALQEDYEVEILFVFDRNGVMRMNNGEEKVITHLSPDHFEEMLKSGEIKEGLIPKLTNGFQALSAGISNVRLGNPGIMLSENSGTKLVLK